MNTADEAAENKCLFLTHFYTGQLYQIPQDVRGAVVHRSELPDHGIIIGCCHDSP